MNWDAQSDRAAIRYYSDWCPDGIQEAHRRGARWQRGSLLSDECVERAARALYAEDVNESTDTPWPDYDSPKNVGRPLYEERARNALTAAIGGDDE